MLVLAVFITLREVPITPLFDKIVPYFFFVVNDKNQRFLFETSIIFSLRLA